MKKAQSTAPQTMNALKLICASTGYAFPRRHSLAVVTPIVYGATDAFKVYVADGNIPNAIVMMIVPKDTIVTLYWEDVFGQQGNVKVMKIVLMVWYVVGMGFVCSRRVAEQMMTVNQVCFAISKRAPVLNCKVTVTMITTALQVITATFLREYADHLMPRPDV
jgi:hypothetical protein